MVITSSAVPGANSEKAVPLPATYTCDGADTPPPLHWTHVPADTKELVVGVLHLASPGGLHTGWMVAGIKPSVHSLSGGKLPSGTFVARNEAGHTGYIVCPAKGQKLTYGAIIYALPHPVAVKPGMKGNELAEKASSVDKTSALFVFTYKRH